MKTLCCSKPLIVFAISVLALMAFFMSALAPPAQAQIDSQIRDRMPGLFTDDKLLPDASGMDPAAVRLQPDAPPQQPSGDAVSDFDGQTLAVRHVTADSTGCLDVQWGNASNGQDVQTWECNQSDAQQWTFEKRAAGDYQDSYRLVSKLGNYCLDNRGDFTTGDRMGIWSCVGDTDGAAANQSVTLAASGDGYTITFTRNSDSKSVWLVTDRASANPKGGANQTTVTDTVPAAAVWRIGADAPARNPSSNNPPPQDPPAQDPLANDPPPPPVQQNETPTPTPDPFDGKTFALRHVTADSISCLEAPWADRTAKLRMAACNDSDLQQWKFEKRTTGVKSGEYRLVLQAGNKGQCLDSSGWFGKDTENMYANGCYDDTYDEGSVTVRNQSFTVTAADSGYTITFSHETYGSTWLTTSRASDSVTGNVGGTAVSGTPPASAIWQIPTGFDGHMLQIYHVTDDSTGCLAVPELTYDQRLQKVGQDVVTAACADTTGQYWQFEQFTSGSHAGAYRLRSPLYSQLLCLDNNGEFATSSKLSMELCAENTNGQGSSTTANQAVAIADSGDGYTLTFVSGSKSAWLTTDRASNSAAGGAGQTTVVDTVPAAAVWGIGTASDRAAGRTNLPPPTITDPYDDKIFKIKVRLKLGSNGYISGCLTPLGSSPTAGTYARFPTLPWCHWHLGKTYSEAHAPTAWKIEKRTGGDYAGKYRLVNLHGSHNLCLDADVDDTLDSGNEYTTTAAGTKGMHVDTCVADTHDDAGSQSVSITRLPGRGAWGKPTYTITFADGVGSDATKVWLAIVGDFTGRTHAGQRIVTNTVHEYATLYLEEQPVEVTRPPADAPGMAPTPAPAPKVDDFLGKTVQLQHITDDSTACLTVLNGTAANGTHVRTAACDDTSAAQQWQFSRFHDKKTVFYLTSQVGDSETTYCLDNTGSRSTEDQIHIWECQDMNGGHAARYNQVMIVRNHGGGHSLLFHFQYWHQNNWLTTSRESDNVAGKVGQTNVGDLNNSEAPPAATGIWNIRALD